MSNRATKRLKAWTLKITTTTPNEVFRVFTAGTTSSLTLDWGDGAIEKNTTVGTISHTYATAGTYVLRIRGAMTGTSRIQFYNALYSSNGSRIKAILNPLRGVTGVSDFTSTFRGCTGLTSLPTDIFRYNTAVSTSGFYQTFYGCTGLASIPTDLFRYNTLVSSSGFQYTFFGCTGLTSLPTDLFRYNTLVSSSGFYATFQGCTGLASLPADLFRYNTSCTSFYQTFYDCTALQQRSDIFFPSGGETTRFLNQSVSFMSCFYITSFTGSTGTAPALWSCSFGTGTPTKTDCWQGHSVSTVDNFASIPADWT